MNQTLNDEIGKKKIKNLKKDWSQLVSIFKTRDPGHELETNWCKPYNQVVMNTQQNWKPT
jgi:hypothetical protein